MSVGFFRENSLNSFLLAQPWPSVLGNPCYPIRHKADCFFCGAKGRVRARKMGLGDLIECLRKGTPKGHGEP